MGARPGPQRHRYSGADHQCGDRPAQARRSDEHRGEEHGQHDELGEEREPRPRPELRLVSSSEITETAVATSSTCRGLTAHAAPRSAIAAMASAGCCTDSGSRTRRPPMIQRSTTTAEPTTTTKATLRTRRNGVATRARSTEATLTIRARRAPRPIGRCADRPTTV